MTDHLTRRTMLAGLAAMGSAPLVGTGAAAAVATGPSLDTLAKARGMRFGSAVNGRPAGTDSGSWANPAYAALLTGECGLVVAENEMKWQALRPAPDRFDFARFDAMIDWADRQHLEMRGHNLLWHQDKWLPRWMATHDFGTGARKAGEQMLVRHIETVCRRYGTRIRSYDVVNEAVTPATGALYDTALSRAIGGAEPTLDLAFRTARAAAPHAQLVYNDYMSWEPGNDRHRAGVLTLLEGFKARGVPVDALGVQSHIMTQPAGSDATKREAEWRRFLDAVTAMGYGLVITELDVRDNNLPADPKVRDRAVADYTRAYCDLMFSYPQLRDVLAWGMSDRYSWIEGFEPRKDGARRRPCPYDDRFDPKPMRDSLAAAFSAAQRS